MRIDPRHSSPETVRPFGKPTSSPSGEATSSGRANSNLESLTRPEIQLRVEALLAVLPNDPPVRAERVREVAARLAEGGYVTEVAARETAAAILDAAPTAKL